ncbi:MAG: zinc metallopeptidase [Armatimonadota bacterium]
MSINPFLVLILLFVVLGFLAQMWVRSSFAKWSRVGTMRGLTGAEVAATVLRDAGLSGVAIEPARGHALSDHYDPRTRTLRLSGPVYSGRSVAAAAVAAHEAGHAIQHAQRYAPLVLRNAAVPLAISADKVVGLLVMVGFMLMWMGAKAPALFLAAGIIYGVAVFFALITLPVEFNASRRAMAALTDSGVVVMQEQAGVRSVLAAAASTYVVAALMSVANMLFYLALARE